MNQADTIRYFDRLASQWTERYKRSDHFRRRLETVLAWVEQEPPGCSLLDFGCGSGVMVRALVERGFMVTGVDASFGMIEAAKGHLHHAPDRYQLETISADGYSGSFEHTTYHGVLCVAVLEYVRDAQALLTELAALTTNGGFLILSVPNRTSVLRKIEWFLHQHPRLRSGAAAFAGMSGSDSYLHLQTQQFTQNALDASLRALGFLPEEILYQVSPSLLRPLENNRQIGMNMMVKYRKAARPQGT